MEKKNMNNHRGLEAEMKTPFMPWEEMSRFRDAIGVWSDTGVTFHKDSCRYAAQYDDFGTFPDAVAYHFKAPCLDCWGADISPGRLMRVVMGFLREEHEPND